MGRSTATERHRRRVLATLLATAALLLVAGCGSSSHSSTASAASSGPRIASAFRTGGLAFAKCMRSNGVTNFPDPGSSDGATFHVGGAIDPSSPAFEAARAKCTKLLGGGLPGSGAPATAQTIAKLVRIARCMRQHGISAFPDPVRSIPADPLASGYREITDFDGAILLFSATINMQAPAYRQALAACGAPPLGLPH